MCLFLYECVCLSVFFSLSVYLKPIPLCHLIFMVYHFALLYFSFPLCNSFSSFFPVSLSRWSPRLQISARVWNGGPFWSVSKRISFCDQTTMTFRTTTPNVNYILVSGWHLKWSCYNQEYKWHLDGGNLSTVPMYLLNNF